MAAKRSPARSTRTKAQARTPAPRTRRAWLRPAALWAARIARPRTARDALTLGFVLLSIATGVALALADARRGAFPAANLAWIGVLALLAAGTRTYGWWRRELAELTAERARLFLASLLLVLCVLSLSWHVLISALGFSAGYLLPGFLDSPPWPYVVLSVVVAASLCLLVNAPVGLLVRTVSDRVTTGMRRASAPRVVESADVSELLTLHIEEEELR